MPVMDGYTATLQIREWESTHGRGRLPIVALTADAFEEDRQRCLSVGMDDFLVKPIDISALKKTLGHWLTTETSAQSETSATPAIELMDRRRYETLLSEAIVLVGQSKFSSLAKVKELQTAVAGTNLETELSEVNVTLQNFHFDAALERLRQLKATQLQ